MQPDPWGGNEPEHKAPEQNQFVDPQVATNPTMQQPTHFGMMEIKSYRVQLETANGGRDVPSTSSAAPKVMGISDIYAAFNFLNIYFSYQPQPDPITGELLK